MLNGRLPNLAKGGVCAWRLPQDESGPGTARALLHQTMAGLGLERDIIEDGKLAVSETATNALRHGRPTWNGRPPAPPELWIWARTYPSPQLVVSIFDSARNALPHASGADLLDEYGKGLSLLSEFTAEWGAAPTRSRLAQNCPQGKTVWFALPLPTTWPGLDLRIHPGTAAQSLLLTLRQRGFSGKRSSDERGISVLEFPGLNIWIHSQHFCWQANPVRHVRHPFIDLQEAAEQAVRHLDAMPHS
jgi:hypothetical protein